MLKISYHNITGFKFLNKIRIIPLFLSFQFYHK